MSVLVGFYFGGVDARFLQLPTKGCEEDYFSHYLTGTLLVNSSDLSPISHADLTQPLVSVSRHSGSVF